MDTLIDQSDADEFPTDKLHNDNIWYLQNHGVHHPRKPEKIELFSTAQ